MLTMSRPMKGTVADRYYSEMARGDYYTKGGEPPGKWHGRGAALLGLSGKVDVAQFLSVLDGRLDGRELAQNAGDPSRRSGWDLTFSAPKSVSVVWALGGEATRHAIARAHEKAVRFALDYLEREAAWSRRGHNGTEIEQVSLVYALFEHGQSRAGDPQLHTHAVLMNAGVRADGTTGTLETLALYKNQLAAGELYKVAYAWELDRMGYQVVSDPAGKSFALGGVPKDLCDTLSKRRAEIEQALRERDLSGARASEIAALDTRGAKVHRPRAELFKETQQHSLDLGYDPKSLLESLRKCERSPRAELEPALKAASLALITKNSTFTQSQFVAKTGELLRGEIIEPKTFLAEAGRYIRESPEVVFLKRRGTERLYTTQALLELEQDMLRRIENGRESGRGAVGDWARKLVFAEHDYLTSEQRTAVEHLTSGLSRVVCMVGKAGAGKSTTLGACRNAWERSGYKVYGAVLGSKAAGELEGSSGIKSETIHATIKALDRGELRLDSRSILVIDEAAMVGTGMLADLVARTEATNTRLVLVGDAGQLQSIEAGGAFRGIVNRFGACAITEIKRQQDERDKEAVQAISEGRAQDAIRNYAERGRLIIGATEEKVKEELIRHWSKEGIDRPRQNVILACTRDDIRDLNTRAQAARASRLSETHLNHKGIRIHEGDLILFTRNSKLYGLRNGWTAEVLKIDSKKRTLTVSLPNGRRAKVPLQHYEHVELGYALTTHRAQGMTAEKGYVLAGGFRQDRELSYVQVSRASKEMTLFVNRQEIGDNALELTRQMNVSHQKVLATELALER